MSTEPLPPELICLPCAAGTTLVGEIAASIWSLGECSRCGQRADVTEVSTPARPGESLMIPSATFHNGKRYDVHLQLSCGCQVASLTEARIAYWQHGNVVCYGALCKGHFAQLNAWPENEAQHVASGEGGA